MVDYSISPRPKTSIRLVGGPAHGKIVEVDPAEEYVRWEVPLPMPASMFDDSEVPAFTHSETHLYKREDFALRLKSGRTRVWRIMIYSPDSTELARDVDTLLCIAFDTFFGPAIDER